MATKISHSLLSAFLHAQYEVFAPGNHFTVHIGERCGAIAGLMADYGLDTVSILTAFNPDAKPTDTEQNLRAQQSMLEEIRKLELPCLPGQNKAQNGDGPIEPTWIVLGLGRAEASTLAQRFRQKAFVFADERAIPELIWIHAQQCNN